MSHIIVGAPVHISPSHLPCPRCTSITIVPRHFVEDGKYIHMVPSCAQCDFTPSHITCIKENQLIGNSVSGVWHMFVSLHVIYHRMMLVYAYSLYRGSALVSKSNDSSRDLDIAELMVAGIGSDALYTEVNPSLSASFQMNLLSGYYASGTPLTAGNMPRQLSTLQNTLDVAAKARILLRTRLGDSPQFDSAMLSYRTQIASALRAVVGTTWKTENYDSFFTQVSSHPNDPRLIIDCAFLDAKLVEYGLFIPGTLPEKIVVEEPEVEIELPEIIVDVPAVEQGEAEEEVIAVPEVPVPTSLKPPKSPKKPKPAKSKSK